MSRPRPSTAVREAQHYLTLLSLALARRDDAVRTMDEQVNGYGSGAGGSGRSTGHSDPVPLLVEKRDKAQAAMEKERALRAKLKPLADEYANLIAGWSPAQIADAKAQRETADDNRARCEPCAAAGYSTEYHRRTDMGGILGHPMWLCGWHIKQIRKKGTMPDDLAVHDHHHRRERVAS